MRLLLAFLALTVSAGANVIVYKGNAHTALDATTQFSKTPRLYLVVDLTSKTGLMVFYFKQDGSKKSMVAPQFDRTRYNSEAIAPDKRIGTFTSVLDNDLNNDFGATMLYLRGRETSLILSNNNITTIGNFPKTLTGILREAQKIGATSTNFEFNFTLTFDPIHTQTANNGFKDGFATLTDLENELAALGY